MRNPSRTGLRLCVASSGLGHVKRGIETWAADLGNELQRRGEQVLLCKGAGPSRESFEQVIPCWTRNSSPAKRMLACLPKSVAWRMGMGSTYGIEQTTFAWNLIQILRKHQIDVLHLQDPQVAVLVQHALRLGWISTRTILNHGTEEPSEFLRRISYVQHGAPWHAEQAKADGVWKETWTTIPNFIHEERFHPGECPEWRSELRIPQNAVVALVSSAIKPKHKRIDQLIREFAIVLHQRADLPLWWIIAGSGNEETDGMIKLGQELLGDRVRFLVGVPFERMASLYRAADMLVHGSFKEMMPQALLEATGSGLPCIIHAHPVMQWMIADGGVAVDQRVDGSVAQAIIRLTENHQERKAMAKNARDHCVANFSREVVIDQITNYYRRVGVPQRSRSA
ncbi:MAG: glycosyltransferase [Planctomycetota bacterium]